MSAYSSPFMPTSPVPYLDFSDSSDSTCSSPEPYSTPEPMSSLLLSDMAPLSPPTSLVPRSPYEQHRYDQKIRDCMKLSRDLPLNLSALPIRYPRSQHKKNGYLTRYPVKCLIALAIRGSPRQALTLSQIYETVEAELQCYQPIAHETAWHQAERRRWQSSVRHSLSLQFMFVQVARRPSHPDEKLRGNYWTLDPFEWGRTRRSATHEEKQRLAAIKDAKKKRPRAPKKSKPAKSRGSLRKSQSPAPQEHYDVEHEYHTFELTHHSPLFDGSTARSRDLSPIVLPSISPLMSSMSLDPALRHDVDPYTYHSQPTHYGLQQSCDYPVYSPELGISPSLIHAPLDHCTLEDTVPVQSPRRSSRFSASRQRRSALIPC